MNDPQPTMPAYCVVMPTYNNHPTLANVLDRLLEQNVPIIVVEDGCTDGSSQLLANYDQIDVVHHEVNRGKGAALRTGLNHAFERGFTHAVAIDSDGQHAPEELPKLIEVSRGHPKAMVIGVRQLAGGGMSLKSKIFRMNSNFWTWVETGQTGGDSQSGYRVYPLEPIDALHLTGNHYDFEVEVLVKAIWLGTPVETVDISVRYNTGCCSHFRAGTDFLRVTKLNIKLVAQAFFVPPPLRRVMVQKPSRELTWKEKVCWFSREYMVAEAETRGKLAACFGVGVAMGILPIWGFQMIAAMFVAHVLRLNKLLVVLASNISFGALAMVVILLSAMVGRLLLGYEGESFWELPTNLTEVGQRLGEYLIGSVVLALAAGTLASLITYTLAYAFGYPRRNAAISEA